MWWNEIQCIQHNINHFACNKYMTVFKKISLLFCTLTFCPHTNQTYIKSAYFVGSKCTWKLKVTMNQWWTVHRATIINYWNNLVLNNSISACEQNTKDLKTVYLLNMKNYPFTLIFSGISMEEVTLRELLYDKCLWTPQPKSSPAPSQVSSCECLILIYFYNA